MKALKDVKFRNAYIQAKCSEMVGVEPMPEDIEFIDIGAMNYVYRVSTPKGMIYFKQALEQAKNMGKIGADLASIHHLRIKTEMNVIDMLDGNMPDGVHVPKPLHYDEENNILMMASYMIL